MNDTNDCEIKFIKTHPDAKLPNQAHEGDNGYDLFAVEDTYIPPMVTKDPIISHTFNPVCVGSGLKVGFITPGYGFVIKPKSGLGFKHGLQPHLGEIDNGYRGDCGVKMYNFTDKGYTFKKGDKVAQIKIERNYSTMLEWTDTVIESDRGEGRLGSTGK